jgi:hypothetical protein
MATKRNVKLSKVGAMELELELELTRFRGRLPV